MVTEQPALGIVQLGLGQVGRALVAQYRAQAEDQERYEALLGAGSGRLLYETTVGAALPVIGTLDALLLAGDEVSAIEAAISGTLGYVTSRSAAGAAFSVALREAQARGYT